MTKPPPDNLMDWPKGELIKEVQRLRAILREHSPQVVQDPHQSPDSIPVQGEPHGQGDSLLDARGAVLMDEMTVVLVDTMRDEPPSMLLVLKGRLNYGTEHVEHAYLYGPDGAAALVSEHIGLSTRAAAARPDFAAAFKTALEERLEQLP